MNVIFETPVDPEKVLLALARILGEARPSEGVVKRRNGFVEQGEATEQHRHAWAMEDMAKA